MPNGQARSAPGRDLEEPPMVQRSVAISIEYCVP